MEFVWTNGSFTKIKRINGVGGVLPLMERLWVILLKGMSTNQTVRTTPVVMAGQVNRLIVRNLIPLKQAANYNQLALVGSPDMRY
jgi:hypothetical protein